MKGRSGALCGGAHGAELDEDEQLAYEENREIYKTF